MRKNRSNIYYVRKTGIKEKYFWQPSYFSSTGQIWPAARLLPTPAVDNRISCICSVQIDKNTNGLKSDGLPSTGPDQQVVCRLFTYALSDYLPGRFYPSPSFRWKRLRRCGTVTRPPAGFGAASKKGHTCHTPCGRVVRER